MPATLHGSRFWIQIGEIDYQRQFVAAKKKLEALDDVFVVKGWMDRDDEDEVAEAVFVVDVVSDQVPGFKRQAGRLGWACRLVETVEIKRPPTEEERVAELEAFLEELEELAELDDVIDRLFDGAA
jgi:hypothetical protein